MELESFYELAQVTDLAVSPDGQRVAAVVDEFDGAADSRRRSLFLVPADDSQEPRRLTRASAASAPAFSPDGSKLGFVAARERDTALQVGRREGKEEEEPEPQVWVFDLEVGGDARQATDREHGVREFDWGPDSERLVISARDPTEEQAEHVEQREDDGPIEVTRLQHKRDGAGWLDDVTSYLFVIDLENGEERRLDDAYGAGSFEPLGGLQPAWGPDGRIAFRSNHTERPDDSAVVDVFTIQPDGSGMKRLTDGEHYCQGVEWSPDGERLSVVARNPPMNWYRPAEVYVIDADDERFESVSTELDRTVALGSAAAWLDEETLVAPVGDEGRSRLVRCHADGAPAERVFTEQGEYRNVTALATGGGRAAVTLTTPGEPPEVYALDGLAEPTRLTEFNDEWVDSLPSPGCQRVRYQTGDGRVVEALAFLPSGFDREDPEPRPVVVKIHGGPMSYDTPGFDFLTSYLASEGYVVLKVNYRGSASYGREFSEVLMGSRGNLESEDILSGVNRLVEMGWADPDRLFATGFSYGGITSAHLAVRTDRFAAIAPEHGIYDFYSNFGTDDNHLWHEAEFGLPWEEPETYREISSLTDVGEVTTPLLITAGQQDWRCPPTQAEQLYVSVRKQGVDAKLVIYQDEQHNVGDPDRAIHRMRELTEWFGEHDPA